MGGEKRRRLLCAAPRGLLVYRNGTLRWLEWCLLCLTGMTVVGGVVVVVVKENIEKIPRACEFLSQLSG